MRECWFNVYEYPVTKEQWVGAYWASVEQANSTGIKPLYRIHVRLK